MKIKILSFIASILLKIIAWTCRYELHFQSVEDEGYFKRAMKLKWPDKSKSFLLAFFHQDELSLIPYFRHSQMGVLISISKDGEIMATMAKSLGYLPVRGSSSKRAVAGLIAGIKKVQEGYKFAFAVDGPRGPIYQVKEGIIAMSNKTGVPILPVRAYPQKYKLFDKSWNQAKLPRPFSKIQLVFGPISVYQREKLEQVLMQLQER